MPAIPSSRHRLLGGDARSLSMLGDGTVHLVVTSPPYPMIGLWDEAFTALSPAAGRALARGDGPAAFEAMHAELDRAWAEVWRVLVPGGIACVNVGDATRTLGEFRLYPNHARILQAATALGFTVLPDILWRKPTNAPNKFMGSGMYPPGAYVTYEHEYVLVLRKGPPRRFSAGERDRRHRSAYFWEERNLWFSDVWSDVRGVRQELGGEARQRSAAFPLEVPWRLVHMFSLQGDTVLDPFAGTGTTLVAAACAGRDSVGVEWDAALGPEVDRALAGVPGIGTRRVEARVAAHLAFVAEREAAGRPPGHRNGPHGWPVVTRQEADLALPVPHEVARVGEGAWEVRYRALGDSDGQ